MIPDNGPRIPGTVMVYARDIGRNADIHRVISMFSRNSSHRRYITVILLLLVQMGLSAALSVTEQVATKVSNASGTVVALGLSDYDGVAFCLSGGYYSVSRAGAQALPIGAGEGVQKGFGARLQYTTFGNDNTTYKITATTDENGSSYLLVGITNLSDPPWTDENGNGEYDPEEDRLSNTLGEIVVTTVNGDRNGTGTGALEYIYTEYGGITPAMFRLFHDVHDTLISGINGDDAWTGTERDQGAQLFYDMVYPCVCNVYYSIVEE